MTTGRCRVCGATVLWTRTVNGAPISLNPLPVRVAMHIVRGDDEGPVDVKQAHEIHLATCTKLRASVRTRA